MKPTREERLSRLLRLLQQVALEAGSLTVECGPRSTLGRAAERVWRAADSHRDDLLNEADAEADAHEPTVIREVKP
jgi:hypothetical protein